MTPVAHPARALACSPRGGGNTDTATALFAQGFTDAVSRILDIGADRVYIAFYPTDQWAWSGALF